MRECDYLDIQPWYKGPYSISTTFVAARPIWKVDYIPIKECIPPTCYQNVNLNYVCINNTKTCSQHQQARFSNRCFSNIDEIPCPTKKDLRRLYEPY
jgi:hypothetical protein